ncbi:MAG: hypothetical protein Q4G04_05270, partial [bacterium]|nr:hypothetical protein [bacterium]
IGKHFHGLVTTSGYGIDELLDPLDNSEANSPVNSMGVNMLPVMWLNDTTLVKADITNTNSTYGWYDYDNKKWANVVMFNDSLYWDEYADAAVGTPIDVDYVSAYYVWIPRYKYQLFNVSFDSSYWSNIQKTNIEFESASSEKSDGTCNGTYSVPTNGCYYTHPAFTWGTGVNKKELDGIWFGKFESSSVEVLPGVYFNTGPQSLLNTYYDSIKLGNDNYQDIYGNDYPGQYYLDMHLTKNIEWGATAYFSLSDYGLGTDALLIYGGGEHDETGGGVDYYNNTNRSTTGNVYGIYDMSGINYEILMATTKNSNNDGLLYGSSGFDSTTLPFSLCSSNTYLDCYDYDMVGNILGDGIGEMQGIQSTDISYPWIARSHHELSVGFFRSILQMEYQSGNYSLTLTRVTAIWDEY